MKERNTIPSFKQVLGYFLPALALFATILASNGSISYGSETGQRIFVFGGIVNLLFNFAVIGWFVYNFAKKDKDKRE